MSSSCLSTVAIETLGTGLVLPFRFIYLHEVRGFTIEPAGTLLAVPVIVGMAVVGPVVAGVMLGARFNVEFIGMLILGCAVMAFIALGVEHRIPAQANGITMVAAAELSRA